MHWVTLKSFGHSHGLTFQMRRHLARNKWSMEKEFCYAIDQHRWLNEMQTNPIAPISKLHQEGKNPWNPLASAVITVTTPCSTGMQQNQPRGRCVYTIVLSLFGWVWVRVGVKLEVGDWYHPYLYFNTGPFLFKPLPSFLSPLKVSTTNDSDFTIFLRTTMEVCILMNALWNKCSSTGEANTREKTGLVASFRRGSINHKSHLSFTQNMIIYWLHFTPLWT